MLFWRVSQSATWRMGSTARIDWRVCGAAARRTVTSMGLWWGGHKMPVSRLNQSLMKPFVVLAIPGMYLVYKYNQFKRQQQENSRRRTAEKELAHLNQKIDKLLLKLDEHEPDAPIAEEEECVICLCAKATMQTFPCGHRVVCRKCFVKTIQVAVTQRCLPLRCVVCRARVLKLKQSAPSSRSKSPAPPQSKQLLSKQSSAQSKQSGAKSQSRNLVPVSKHPQMLGRGMPSPVGKPPLLLGRPELGPRESLMAMQLHPGSRETKHAHAHQHAHAHAPAHAQVVLSAPRSSKMTVPHSTYSSGAKVRRHAHITRQ